MFIFNKKLYTYVPDTSTTGVKDKLRLLTLHIRLTTTFLLVYLNQYVKDPFTPSKLSPRDDLERKIKANKMRGEGARNANQASRSERLMVTIKGY